MAVPRVDLRIWREAKDLSLLPGAPQADEDRFNALKILPRQKKPGMQRLSLDVLAAPHDPDKKRYRPGGKEHARNRAYLLHIIMKGEGRGAFLPDEYGIPSDVQTLPVKRGTDEVQPPLQVPEVHR